MPDILAAFARVKRSSSGASAQCPAHKDANNSLSIRRGQDGRWLLKCHAGCAVEAILAAAHLTMADLFSANGHSHDHTPIATFDYRDESGVLLIRRVDSRGRLWLRAADGSWSIGGIRRVLYRLPELRGHATVFIPEGEKDVDRLWAVGLPATTNPGGAGKWRAEDAALLTAAGCRRVVVFPDHDPVGATHGRTVARACVDAGLDVQLIPLPDLPEKGDVSDYLARHTAADLLALVRDSPFYRDDQSVTCVTPLTLTSVADLLSEPDEATAWIVEARIPAGAVVLMVGAPKAGKSTCLRELALDVAQGEPWLGFRTTRGAVWLLVFEDQRAEVTRHLRQLGATGDEPLRVFIGQAPTDLLPQLQARASTDRPALIIVDTLARAIRLKDINDYAQVSTALTPWLQLARESGATLLLAHHASAHADRDGLNAVLGSTAFAGSCDNTLLLRRVDGRRVLSSTQRIGPDLEPMIVTLNAATGRLECAGTKRLVDDRELRDRLVAALDTAGESVRETWLHDQVDGRKADKIRALRVLLSQRRVVRSGGGVPRDPYRYRRATPAEERESLGTTSDLGTTSGRAIGQEPHVTKVAPINPGLFSSSSQVVPKLSVPCIRGTYPVRGGSTTYNHESSNVVPAGSDIAHGDPSKTPNDPDKHCLESGSQILRNDDDDGDERF